MFVLIHDCLAEDDWEVLAVGDVLDLRPHDAAGLLEQLLVVPVRVDGGQLARDLVVLPHPQRVYRHQPDVLVHPHVARLEALGAVLRGAVDRVVVRGQEVARPRGLEPLDPQQPAREQPQLLGLLLGAAVDDGAVQVGGHLVDLLPGPQRAASPASRAGPEIICSI